MLKAKPIKHKNPKHKKAKPRVKKPLSIHQERQASHYQPHQIHTQGFFNPFSHNTGLVQSSNVPQARPESGGIPYTSTFETYGITNKPPYFLESLLPQNIRPNYETPVQPQTGTTISGGNPVTQPKPKEFIEQGKTQTVDYVDLVAPSKKGNSETQPDYISLQPVKAEQQTKPIKERLMERAEYRKKNNISPDKKVSEIMTAHGGLEALHRAKMEEHGFLKPKPNLRGKKRKQNDEL
jgi:hypothetical protein